MDEIKVKVAELREVIAKNRDSHRKTFEAAFEVYRERATKHLEQMLDDARNGRKIVRALGLVEPIDYTHEYDRVLKMLEMTVDEVLEISARDFGRFVMDNWDWKEHFTASTTAYLST